jgi:hypothetical protein
MHALHCTGKNFLFVEKARYVRTTIIKNVFSRINAKNPCEHVFIFGKQFLSLQKNVDHHWHP